METEIWRVYGDEEFQVLSICSDHRLGPGGEIAAEWRDDYGVTCPILLNSSRSVLEQFNSHVIPYNALIDRQSRLAYSHAGFNLAETIAAIEVLGINSAIELISRPKSITLLSNSPNPFNQSTTIEFVVERAGPVEITIFDILGRNVAQLLNATMTAGAYSAHWNGRTEDGVALPSGPYWIRLRSSEQSQTHCIVLIR